jgi:arylamine N-acetyltransferase
MVAKVDLDAYFQRIHWSGGREPTLETLAGLI